MLGCLSNLQIQGHEVSRSFKGLISNVNYDEVSFRSRSIVSSTVVGLLVVVNDSTTTFLECKGA